jgi:hypothetical protein
MILEIEGVVIPQCYRIHSYTNAPVKDAVLFAHPPKWVVPLKDANWPSDVVEKIAKAFACLGLPRPLESKLIEPYAIVFGGNTLMERKTFQCEWEMVVDYFTWEAHAQAGPDYYDEACCFRMKLKKVRRIFTHRGVYDDPKDPNKYY